MRLWKENLLLQFSVISFVAMSLLAVLLSFNLANSASRWVLDEAAAEARDTLSQRILRHLNPEDMDKPMAGEKLQSFSPVRS